MVDGTLRNLIDNHFTDDKWREVILLTAGMLDRADMFFRTAETAIKGIAHKNNLSNLLGTINDLTQRSTPYPSVITRCFLLIDAIIKAGSLDESRRTGKERVIRRHRRTGIELAKHLYLGLTQITTSYHKRANLRDVRRLIKRLYEYGRGTESFFDAKGFYRHKGIENDMERILSHFRVRVSDVDMQNGVLDRYVKANTLLIECLNSDCYVSNDIRKSIFR